jgi:Holliday junction resolvase RusA-like endonuclease
MPTPYREWRDGLAGEVLAQLKQARLPVPCYGAGVELELKLSLTGKSGDLDNLAGGIMDALTGVFWTDDSQITRLIVSRDKLDNGLKWLAQVSRR